MYLSLCFVYVIYNCTKWLTDPDTDANNHCDTRGSMVQGFQRIHSHIATVSTHRRKSDACRLYGHLHIAKPFVIMCSYHYQDMQDRHAPEHWSKHENWI